MTFPQPTTQRRNPALRYLITIPLIVGLIYAKGWLRERRLGHHAARAEVVGSWVHQSGEVTLELSLKPDGHFDRLPKFVDLASDGVRNADIPETGTWTLDEGDGLLTLASTPTGGAFYPYVDGDTLNLAAASNKRMVFRFTRKK
jgi:hypothetical protein